MQFRQRIVNPLVYAAPVADSGDSPTYAIGLHDGQMWLEENGVAAGVGMKAGKVWGTTELIAATPAFEWTAFGYFRSKPKKQAKPQ